MLRVTELASMREQAAQALPDTCTIVSVTLTSDGRLGNTESEVTVASDVPCRLDEMGEGTNQRDYELAASIASRGGTLVRLPWNTSIEEKHRIKVGTRTLEVQRVLRQSYATLVSVVTSEVR